jgi:hypothetical protein
MKTAVFERGKPGQSILVASTCCASIATVESKSKNRAEWITAICTLLMACTAIVALFYAYRQLKQDHEEAQVERLLNEIHQYDQEPMVTYRKAYGEQRLKGVVEPPAQYHILDFFETIGLLVDHGYLDETDVWENFGYSIFPLYADTRDTIDEAQKENPTYYNHFISLIARMRAVEKAQHGDTGPVTKEDIKEYWQDEAGLVSGAPPTTRKHLKK